LALAATLLLLARPVTARGGGPLRTAALSNEEAWKKLPRAEQGAGQPLPVWARVLAATMPHTTAAMLELDYQHRAESPLDAKLRARMRWTAAHALHCAYSQAYATADLRRAGAGPDEVRALAGDPATLPEAERGPLVFARKMAVEPHAVTDAEVARLIQRHGEKQVVAMVLLVAHAGFQDRLLWALDLPVEAGGPLGPDANVLDGFAAGAGDPKGRVTEGSRR
jgi:alkylhydroperoxidase family enzyme